MKNEAKRIDTKYVKRYQQNQDDMEAFNAIYEFYYNPLYYFSISYIKKAADAEEVVQDTFVKVIRHIQSLQSPEAFHAWLYQICYSAIMMKFRKEKKYVELDEEYNIEETKDENDTPELYYEKKEVYSEIKEAMKELGVKFEVVTRMYYFDDLKIKEISKILGIPEGTVKTRLMKGKKRLKIILEEKGITPAKYFSFAPFIYQFYKITQQQLQMNPIPAQTLLANTTSEATIATSTFALTQGVNHVAKVSMQKILTSFIGASIITSGYVILTSDANIINTIEYSNEMTRDKLETIITLNKEINENEVKIIKNEQLVPFELGKDAITFIIEENGEYEIQVKDEKETLNITNIDRNAPSIISYNIEDDKIYLDLKEETTIDYQKSYAVYQNQQFEIKDNYIYGIFDSDLDIHLYDTVGNYAQYKLTFGG